MTEYSPSEFMITAASRALAGERIVFVGVGLPNIACNLAQRTVAPELELVYESGVFGARPERLPLSIGDPTLISGSTMTCSQMDLFMNYLQGGRIEVAFLGAAQIDRYGNLNSTVIGNYEHPKVRLPGSGGACEIAIHAKKIFMIMRLKKRAFVERLDFLTSPGHLRGNKKENKKIGIRGEGPKLVVTDMGIFRFDGETGEMYLSEIRFGVDIEKIKAEIAWPIKISKDLAKAKDPTPEEVRIIREELDPEGIHSN